MNLALFDLDNTLIAGDSDFQWAQFLIEQKVLDREVYEARNIEFYEQYKAGTLDIHEFLDFQLKPLARHPREQLNTWREEFIQKKIRPIIAPGALELIAKHKLERNLCIIITAAAICCFSCSDLSGQILLIMVFAKSDTAPSPIISAMFIRLIV